MANSTGISFEDLMGINMLPEIIKAECSMIGAFGDSTRISKKGDLLQLRSLDWAVNAPLS